MIELAPQDFDQVRLDEDHRRELIVRTELELRLISAREAVVTGMRAAAVGIQSPVEGHALHLVDCGTAGDLLIARGIRPQPGLVEGGRSSFIADPQCQRSRGWGAAAEVEESGLIRHCFAVSSPLTVSASRPP